MQPATCHLSIHKVVTDDYLSVSAMFGKRQSWADNGRGFHIKLLVGAWLKSWRSEQLTKRSCRNEDTCCRRTVPTCNVAVTVEKKRWFAIKMVEILSCCKWPRFQNLGSHEYFPGVKGYADSNMHINENTPVKKQRHIGQEIKKKRQNIVSCLQKFKFNSFKIQNSFNFYP